MPVSADTLALLMSKGIIGDDLVEVIRAIDRDYAPEAKARCTTRQRTPQTDDAFERFWRLYPARAGSNPKKPAADKFAVKVRGGADPEAIIAGAQRYADDVLHSDPKFVAQAVTWLNQERWKDGPQAVRAVPRRNAFFAAVQNQMEAHDERGYEGKRTLLEFANGHAPSDGGRGSADAERDGTDRQWSDNPVRSSAYISTAGRAGLTKIRC